MLNQITPVTAILALGLGLIALVFHLIGLGLGQVASLAHILGHLLGPRRESEQLN